jgi:hypothetical protein
MAYLPQFELGTFPVQVLHVTAKLACSVRGVSLLHSLQGTDLLYLNAILRYKRRFRIFSRLTEGK